MDTQANPFGSHPCPPHDAPEPLAAAKSRPAESNRERQLGYVPKRLRPGARLKTIKDSACLIIGIVASVLLAVTAGPEPARAQVIPKSLEQGGTAMQMKQRKNAWTVAVAGGQLSGTYMTLVDEMAQVLDDGDNLRVIPIVTYGAASNLDDLLYLRQVDLVITQSDIFDYFRTQRKTPNLESRVHYLIRLPISEMHLLAGTDINSIEELSGKKVSFGPAGSASSLTGTIVFQRLGVKVEQVFLDNATALKKLKAGEIAGLVRVIGKPVDFFANIPANSGLHLVPIPFSRLFADQYALGEFTSEEYPTLVPEGKKIDTIGVPAVLAVYNWPKDSDRYRRVERFAKALFTNWEKFNEPHRHPKWREVNLAATVPGWTRWNVADEMLKRIQPRDPKVSDFQLFLEQRFPAVRNLTETQQDALFREFVEWHRRSNIQR